MLIDQRKTVVAVDPSRPETIKNLAYVHEHCSRGQVAFYQVNEDITDPFDIYQLLERIRDGKLEPDKRRSKYLPLSQYFEQRADPFITLTFSDIEDILEQPLPPTAYLRKNAYYWYINDGRRISNSWRDNGYKLHHLDFEGQVVTFERTHNKYPPVKIPSVFLSGRVPPNAKAEVENMFAFIIKKYGL